MQNKRYWLAGLIIGFFFGLVVSIGDVVVGLSCMGFYNGIEKSSVCSVLFKILDIIRRIHYSLFVSIGGSTRMSSIMQLLLPLVTLTILGLILGLIYGKIKNRRRISV
jgi:hypothetical protein